MDWITLIIVIVASLGIGYFSAVLIANSKRDEAPDGFVPPDDPDELNQNEVFRLLRTPDGRGVMTEIQRRKVKSAGDLTAEEHAQISMGLVDLYAWLERSNRPALSKEAQASAQHVQKEIQTGELSPAVVSAAPPAVSEPARPPSLNIFKSLRRTTQSEIAEKVAPEEESIASQVDEILQRKLDEQGMDEKAVRLLNLEGQGMVIMVGLDKYADLDDVPDEELRDLIRESVSEWESRMLRSS